MLFRSLVAALCADALPGQRDSRGVKGDVYRRHFLLPPRPKFHGFENVMHLDDELRPVLRDRLGAHDAVARIAYFLSIIVLSFVAIFLVWANKAVLDEVTRGDASVIPSGHNQVVQNLEGGILAELLVHDGELVNRNDVLLRIANTTAASNLQEMRAQYYALMGQIARLSAEANGKDVVFPDELRQEAPQVANNEDSLHRARMLQLETQSAVIQDQVTQREGEISELRGRLQALTRNLELAKEERAITIPLVPVGAAARVDLVRLERQVADLEGQVNSVRLSIPRAEAALTEAKDRKSTRLNSSHIPLSRMPSSA